MMVAQIQYGFKRGKNGKIIKIEREQKIIKVIIDMHNQGMTPFAIAKELNQQHLFRKVGAKIKWEWRNEAIAKVLWDIGFEPIKRRCTKGNSTWHQEGWRKYTHNWRGHMKKNEEEEIDGDATG